MNKKYEYFVNLETYTDNYEDNEANDNDDDYSSWSSTTSFDINGVDFSKGKIEAELVLSSYEFQSGETAYLVFIGWGHGDSFGHAENGGWEAIHLFKDLDLAKMLKMQIQYDCLKSDGMSSTFDYMIDDNSFVSLSTGAWKDYFGGIDTLYVCEVRVGEIYCSIISNDTSVLTDKTSFQNEFLALSEKIKLERFMPSQLDNSKVGKTLKL